MYRFVPGWCYGEGHEASEAPPGRPRVPKTPSSGKTTHEIPGTLAQTILEKGTFNLCAKLWYAPNPVSKEI